MGVEEKKRKRKEIKHLTHNLLAMTFIPLELSGILNNDITAFFIRNTIPTALYFRVQVRVPLGLGVQDKTHPQTWTMTGAFNGPQHARGPQDTRPEEKWRKPYSQLPGRRRVLLISQQPQPFPSTQSTLKQ